MMDFFSVPGLLGDPCAKPEPTVTADPKTDSKKEE